MFDDILESNYQLFVNNWIKGIESELMFWEYMISNDEIWLPKEKRNKQTTNINDKNVMKILDVGAGPMTILTPNNTSHIIAVDPLALYYNKLLDKYNRNPILRTEFCFSERLYERFEENYFDQVHMSNALDHSFFPMISLFNFLYVVKKGGKVLLYHAQNEAEFEKYLGFHQFNIDIQDGKAVFWNKSVKIILEDILNGIAEIECCFLYNSEIDRNWVKIEITKKSNFNILDYVKNNHYFDKYIFL